MRKNNMPYKCPKCDNNETEKFLYIGFTNSVSSKEEHIEFNRYLYQCHGCMIILDQIDFKSCAKVAYIKK